MEEADEDEDDEEEDEDAEKSEDEDEAEEAAETDDGVAKGEQGIPTGSVLEMDTNE